MAKRSSFLILALHCGTSKVSDANATVDVDLTFEIWARQILTECSISTGATYSAFLQISPRMTHLTRLFKQDYKKTPELEDILNWTTGVEEVLDGNGDIEVDRVPVDMNLVAAMEALDFALLERYALYKLDPVSEAHANRRQTVKKNWFALTNMALETTLLAALGPCLALQHMQEFHAVMNNDLDGGLITDEQANNLFEFSSLQLIVHASSLAWLVERSWLRPLQIAQCGKSLTSMPVLLPTRPRSVHFLTTSAA